MQPFLEIPKVITNNEQKEKLVTARLQPAQIEDYYPGFYDGTVVVMKSGNSFFTPMSVEEFDNALAGYEKFIKANTGKFGNLKLTPKPKIHAAN